MPRLPRLLSALAFAAVAHGAQAIPINYVATLSGAAEAPPNASAGTGSAHVVIDTDAHTYAIHFDFSGLTGTTTAAHIHGPTASPGTGTAGVMTTTPAFPGFVTGVSSGSYDHLFDMTVASTFNPAFVTAQGGLANAEAAFAAALASGSAYLNIHTTAVGLGEIRGFLTQIPEPASLGLLAIGALGLGRLRARRR
ncbi:MAG: CHRD domain-containing protein [Proteobacteria bacterium]|nr:CHRD domain-containing protein [Pseudomonadota bacterium]